LDYTSGLPAIDASSDEQNWQALTALPALAFQPGTAYIYYDNAIKILDLSTLQNLQNTGGMSYAFGLIGECYLDPTNLNAKGMVQQLSGHN
jgi:hypothetical protein